MPVTAARVEAIAACVTALVAVAALIGVKVQLDDADRLQKTQAARAAYRAHLSLAVAHPSFADPADSCALALGDQGGAYAAFVDHLVYSAELMLDVDPSWDQIFIQNLIPHAGYVCASWTQTQEPPGLAALLNRFAAQHCTGQTACTAGQ